MRQVTTERPEVSVRHRVIGALAAAAAAEVPGVVRVARGHGLILRWLAGPPVRTDSHDGLVDVHIWFLARRGTSLPQLTERVRHAVASAVERQMGLRLGEVTVTVDGVRG